MKKTLTVCGLILATLCGCEGPVDTTGAVDDSAISTDSAPSAPAAGTNTPVGGGDINVALPNGDVRVDRPDTSATDDVSVSVDRNVETRPEADGPVREQLRDAVNGDAADAEPDAVEEVEVNAGEGGTNVEVE